jgi:hypothetical protein
MTLVLALLVLAVSIGCNNGNGSSPDGSTDTGTSDADADSDGDGDSDSDTDTWITDAGPWDWEPLPEMEDCGPRCRRITSQPDVMNFKWDVAERHVVYANYQVQVVDYEAMTTLKIPELHSEHPMIPGSAAGLHPAVDSGIVTYTFTSFDMQDLFHEIVIANLLDRYQAVIDHIPFSASEVLEPPQENDLRYPFAASLYGCSVYQDPNLCHSDVSLNGPATSLGALGPWSNTIWGDYLVFLRNGPFGDVRGYRYSTQEFFDITNDDEIQFVPRVHGSLVVYQDLRLGDSTLEGDWNHSSIWLYDIETEQTVQITDGSSIADGPDVFGDIVIWEDFRLCPDPQNKNQFYCVEVFGKNLATDVEFQITNLPTYAKQPPPRIWGDKVFVHMYPPSGGSALFVFDLPPEAD